MDNIWFFLQIRNQRNNAVRMSYRWASGVVGARNYRDFTKLIGQKSRNLPLKVAVSPKIRILEQNGANPTLTGLRLASVRPERHCLGNPFRWAIASLSSCRISVCEMKIRVFFLDFWRKEIAHGLWLSVFDLVFLWAYRGGFGGSNKPT